MTQKQIEDRIHFTMDYAICEILGKQYKITPNQPIDVDFLGSLDKEIEAKLLALSENGKIKVGAPYLKDKLTLQYLDTVKISKIRVARFHAKANYRKVTGQKKKKTRLIFREKILLDETFHKE